MTECTVCASDRRHQVEIGLVHQVPLRVLARRFGLSLFAIHRHGKNHLSPQVRAAILTAQKPSAVDLAELQKSEAEGILSQLILQRARLQSHSEMALEVGNPADAVRVEAGITKNLELVARLLGTLQTHHTVTHQNVLISSDYLRLRQTLLEALRPFPEAMAAVSAALHRLESEAAKDIQARHGNGKTPLILEHDPSETVQ